VPSWSFEQALSRRAQKSPGTAFSSNLYPLESWQVQKVERPS